jgi:hypothetical protein
MFNFCDPTQAQAAHAFLWENGSMIDLNTFVPKGTDITLNWQRLELFALVSGPALVARDDFRGPHLTYLPHFNAIDTNQFRAQHSPTF